MVRDKAGFESSIKMRVRIGVRVGLRVGFKSRVKLRVRAGVGVGVRVRELESATDGWLKIGKR